LAQKIYRHGAYRTFIVADSKKRTIKAAPFRDRVVHHAVCNIIEPIFDPSFIHDSYACRKGKGSHAAVKRLEHFIHALTRERERERERDGRNAQKLYYLKCDISKFFESIDGAILFDILRRKIHDENTLWLLREIIESNPVGIPIGNLTSQLFANIYLNELDHFVKRELREWHYVRYMDDFLILGTNKAHLQDVRERIRFFLADRLKLTLHPKKAEIAPVDRGIDFLGYVMLPGGRRRLRKSTVKRFLRRRRRYEAMVKNGRMTEELYGRAIDSWRGYARFADSYRLLEKLGLREKGK
jgi:RNA-directed DNA polymerase